MPYLNNDIVHVGYRCLIMCFFNMKSADPRKWIDDTDTNKKDGSHRIVMKPVLSFYSTYRSERCIRTHFFHGAKVLILETNNPCTNLSYINLFNSSTSLNTVVEDTACDGGVLPNSANIFLALDMASG